MLPPSHTDTAVSMFERLLEGSKLNPAQPRRSIKEGWSFADHEELLPNGDSPIHNNSRDRASVKFSSALSKLVVQVQEETKKSGFDSEPDTPLSVHSSSLQEVQRSRISSSGGASWSVFSETSNIEQPIIKIDGPGPEVEGFAFISAETYLAVSKNLVDENGYFRLRSESHLVRRDSRCSFGMEEEFRLRKIDTYPEKASSSRSSICSRRSNSTVQRRRPRHQEGPATAKEQRYQTSSSSSSSSLEGFTPSKPVETAFAGLNEFAEEKLSLNSIFEWSAAPSRSEVPTGHLKQMILERPPANSFSTGIKTSAKTRASKQEHKLEHVEAINSIDFSSMELLNHNLLDLGRDQGKHYRLITLDCRYFYEYAGGHLKGALNISSPQAMSFLFTELQELLTSDEFLADLLATSGSEIRLQDLQRISASYKSRRTSRPEQGSQCSGAECLYPCNHSVAPSQTRGGNPQANLQVVPVFVLHCEFSSQRAPNMYNLIRQIDRTSNKVYPKLTFPQMFVIRGGYEACSIAGRLPYRRMLLHEYREECAKCECTVTQEWKLLKKLKSGQSSSGKGHFGKSTRASTGLSLNSLLTRQAKNPSIFASQHSELRNESFGGEEFVLSKPVLRPNPFQETTGFGQTNAERLFGSLATNPTEDLFHATSESQFYSR